MTYQGTEKGRPFYDHTPPAFKQGVYDAIKNETHYFDYEDSITFRVLPGKTIEVIDRDEDTGLPFNFFIPPQPIPTVIAVPPHTTQTILAYRLRRRLDALRRLLPTPPVKTPPVNPPGSSGGPPGLVPGLGPGKKGSFDEREMRDLFDMFGGIRPTGWLAGMPTGSGGPGMSGMFGGLGTGAGGGGRVVGFTPGVTGRGGGRSGSGGLGRMPGRGDFDVGQIPQGGSPSGHSGAPSGAGGETPAGFGGSVDAGLDALGGAAGGAMAASGGARSTGSHLGETPRRSQETTQTQGTGNREGGNTSSSSGHKKSGNRQNPYEGPGARFSGVGFLDYNMLRTMRIQASTNPGRSGPVQARRPDGGDGGIWDGTIDIDMFDPISPVAGGEMWDGIRPRGRMTGRNPGNLRRITEELRGPDDTGEGSGDDSTVIIQQFIGDRPRAPTGEPTNPHAGGGTIVAVSAGVTTPTVRRG